MPGHHTVSEAPGVSKGNTFGLALPKAKMHYLPLLGWGFLINPHVGKMVIVQELL